ncbi:response regulator transcription factor [Luteolibacter marinus]|uniref:response regulator transcription factor n=1 Tax=Luteolibacter marinus TaxID=2776705 RepID=UPI001D02D385|nr:helix-turn-helix transcriptional regulator [Luteolibacter marinus]
MLGKPYFDLARAIYRASGFDDLVDLLVAKLPHLIGADEAVVLTYSPMRGAIAVTNHGPRARLLSERIDVLNRLLPKSPVTQKVDFANPGDLGFAMSDHVSPEDYKNSEFARGVFGDQAANDVLFGLMVNGKRRTAFLNCYMSAGTFGYQARERFDAILLTARGVLDRMEAHGLELAVRQRVFANSAESALAIFILNLKSELCPLNHAAVRLAENWWEPDEAVRQLTPKRVAELDDELDDAWENPVAGVWKDIRLDLGGGQMTVHAFPKLSGEVILMFAVDGEGGSEEAMAILTKRQREIMDWIAEGKTSAEAAIILGISPRTVEKHLEAVFQRLGVENRIAAMRRYLDLKRGV